MRLLNLVILIVGLVGPAAGRAESAGELYLRHVFGDPDIEISSVCWPNDDLWMLAGEKNDAGLAEIAAERIDHAQNEVLWVRVQGALCFVEVREGRVDPRLLLDQIALQHRQLVLQFIYAALTHDRKGMARLTTNSANVKLGAHEAPPDGDLDVYEELISILPVVRVSSTVEDKTTRSITYRLPLGKSGFDVRLVKRGTTWLVDAEKPVAVPLEFFFE